MVNKEEMEMIKEILVEKGYEYYKGQAVQGDEPHFFIKGKKLVQVIVNEWADDEVIESIKQLK